MAKLRLVTVKDTKKQLRVALSIAVYHTRKHLGLTQVELSRLLGVSQSHLSKVEKGELTFAAVTWMIFCSCTSIDPNIIFLPKREMLGSIKADARLKTHSETLDLPSQAA